MKKKFRIKNYGLLDHIFDIQVKVFGFWITIVRFSDFEDKEFAELQANEVFDILTN